MFFLCPLVIFLILIFSPPIQLVLKKTSWIKYFTEAENRISLNTVKKKRLAFFSVLPQTKFISATETAMAFASECQRWKSDFLWQSVSLNIISLECPCMPGYQMYVKSPLYFLHNTTSFNFSSLIYFCFLQTMSASEIRDLANVVQDYVSSIPRVLPALRR